MARWQRGIVCQVYPRSFQDTDGDGSGDLRGVTRRLEDLAWLGIDAVWLSPIFPSPMTDFGYDVADYCEVDPLFGTLDEFNVLRDRAHALGLKLILDSCPTTAPTSTPGSSRAAAAATVRTIGISGTMRRKRAVRPTIGSPISAAP